MVKLLLKQVEDGQLGGFAAEMKGKRRRRKRERRRNLKMSIYVQKGLSLRMGRTCINFRVGIFFDHERLQ